MQYRTSTPAAGFGGPGIAARMTQHPAPFETQSGNDVYSGIAQQRGVELERYAQQAQGTYESARQAKEIESVLAGLNQLAQSQQGERALADQQVGMLTSFAGSLLGGLLR
jgi:hypothetical protein